MISAIQRFRNFTYLGLFFKAAEQIIVFRATQRPLESSLRNISFHDSYFLSTPLSLGVD